MRRHLAVLLLLTALLSLLSGCSRPPERPTTDGPAADGPPGGTEPAAAQPGTGTAGPAGASVPAPATEPLSSPTPGADAGSAGTTPTPDDSLPAGVPAGSDAAAPAGSDAAAPAGSGGNAAGRGGNAGAGPAAPAVGRGTPPDPLRGIHLSGWVAGTPSKRDPLLKWARQTGFNAVVLELKAEDGRLTWNSDIPLAREIGANARKVGDLAATVQMLHDQGFWAIGRVVCFNDPILYAARPDLRVPGLEGTRFRFVNPLDETVRRYALDIALAGAAAGFDEIQFDYIRWAEKRVPGYTLDTTVEFRTGAINSFLEQAVQELKPLGIFVSADVFGLTTSVNIGDDMHIGQDYARIAAIVDYISPMAYPSHYANGTYGIAIPDREPYLTVKTSLERAIERSPGIPLTRHRPWIQDFQYPAPGFMAYTEAEVESQIRALAELGIHSFLVWDPNNHYTRDVELPSP